MTDNELKVEALRVAVEIARESMFARRITAENRWESRSMTSGIQSFPDLPGIELDEVIKNYTAIVRTMR